MGVVMYYFCFSAMIMRPPWIKNAPRVNEGRIVIIARYHPFSLCFRRAFADGNFDRLRV